MKCGIQYNLFITIPILYSNILVVAMLLAFPLLVHTQNNNVLFITV
jgi:hypothetical protein